VVDQEGLGVSVVFAESHGKARYSVALAAADAGYLSKANPAAIRCIRAPEYDASQLLAARPNLPFDPEYLKKMTTPHPITISLIQPQYHQTSPAP
jgi:hypothetical protein